MPQHTFTSLNGDEFALDLPDSTRSKSTFVLSPPKAGSVLINNVIKAICIHSDLPFFDFEPQLFKSGVSPLDCPLAAFELLESPGYVFLGFRTPFMVNYSRQYRASPKLILVRDPRDMLVSYYFSIAKSHPAPGAGAGAGSLEFSELRNAAAMMGVNEYISALHGDHIVLPMRVLTTHIETFPDCHLFRYEDIIFRKAEWIRSMCSVLGVSISDDFLQNLLQQFDIRPDTERPDQHIRQVAPGNYKRHLTWETIAGIQDRFADVFDYFSYKRENKLLGTFPLADQPSS